MPEAGAAGETSRGAGRGAGGAALAAAAAPALIERAPSELLVAMELARARARELKLALNSLVALRHLSHVESLLRLER